MNISAEEYKKFIQSRRGLISPIVKEKLEILIKDHPEITRVWLTGSYAKGDWIDQCTPEWVVQFKKSMGWSKTKSDVDFIVEPEGVKTTSDYDIIADNKNKILIYDNGNTII